MVWIVGIAACGARSSIGEPDAGAPAGDASIDAAARSCPPECAVGHLCCAGGCDGPEVPMASDCCACLPGEVSSWDCGGTCGGGP